MGAALEPFHHIHQKEENKNATQLLIPIGVGSF
jgi:hypothetical protein